MKTILIEDLFLQLDRPKNGTQEKDRLINVRLEVIQGIMSHAKRH